MARILVAVVVSSTFQTGCDLGTALDTANAFDPVIHVDRLETVVAGRIVDAQTGAAISDVHIRFAGEDPSVVRDLFDKPLSELLARDGAASFAVSNTVLPSSKRPFDLRVIASAEGYRPNSARVSIANTGAHEFLILMERVDTPMAAELVADAEGLLRGKSLWESLFARGHGLGEQLLTAAFPAGAEFEFSGQGPLHVEARLALPSPAMLALFPGGLDAGILPQEGPFVAASLTTGALVRVATTVDGVPVSSGHSIQVTTALSRSLLSPLTNEPVRPGDLVDIHRWHPEKAQWESFQRARTRVIMGHLAVSFPAPPNGVYSVGYWNAPCEESTVRLSGNTLGGSVVAFRGAPGQADGYRIWRFAPGEEAVPLHDPPGFWRGEMRIYHGDEVRDVPYDTLCDAQFELALVANTLPVERRELALTPAPCPALRVTDLPTLALFVGRSSSPSPGPLALLTEPTRLLPRPTMHQDRLGRVSVATTEEGGGSSRILVVLGGRSWDLAVSGGQAPIAQMARETGLCAQAS